MLSMLNFLCMPLVSEKEFIYLTPLIKMVVLVN